MLPDPLAFLSAFAAPLEGTAMVDRVRRGAWLLATTPRPPVGETPHVIVHTHDKLVVRYYAPRGEHRARTPVVLVPSQINKAYILDLEPKVSLVAALAERGHPTYLIDWGAPGPEDADEDVGYVLHQLLHRSIARICGHAGAPSAHVFGYCQGGTLAAMLAALRPEGFASLVTLAAPVKFAEGGRFRDFVAALDVDAAIDGDGLVPVGVMKPAFQLLDPMGNWSKHLAIEAAANHPERLATVLRRERWLEENVPMTGAFAQEFIARGYQRDELIAGTWDIRGERVDLGRIRCRTLVLSCEGDFISPAPAVEPLADLVPGARKERLPTGHIGAVVGSFAPKRFHPLLDAWFREPTQA